MEAAGAYLYGAFHAADAYAAIAARGSEVKLRALSDLMRNSKEGPSKLFLRLYPNRDRRPTETARSTHPQPHLEETPCFATIRLRP